MTLKCLSLINYLMNQVTTTIFPLFSSSFPYFFSLFDFLSTNVKFHSQCKYYGSERERQPRNLEPRNAIKITRRNKPHPSDVLGKIQEGGFLCSGEKQQGAKQEAGFIGGFLGAEGLVGF